MKSNIQLKYSNYAAFSHFCGIAVNNLDYFIIDKNNSLKEELEGQESVSSDKLEFRHIYSLEEVEI